MRNLIFSKIFLSFLSLVSVFTLLMPLSVSAASAYDDVYRTTSNIYVKDGSCSQVEITTNWSEYILEESRWPTNTQWRQDVKNSFNQALSTGRWGVSQGTDSGGGKYAIVYWTTDNQLSLEWLTTGVRAKAPPYQGNYVYISAYNATSTSPCVPAITSYGLGNNPGGGYSAIMSNTSNIENLFIYTDYPNYPTGYEGDEIVSILQPFADHLFYKIVDKVGQFTPKDIDTSRITKCTLFIDDNPAVEADDGANEAIYEITDCASTVTHNWQSYGTYYVRLELEHASGVRQYTHTFEVDGRTYEGQFDTEGNTDAATIDYEDCSVYGVDIVAGIGCHFRNFGKWLQALFVSLFVPAPGYMSSFFAELRDFFTSKLGFLFWPVGFAIDLVSAFFQGTSSTLSICNWSFGNVFGRDFKLNFCSFEQSFPVQFNTARYIIQAFTVFALVTGLYREYRRILTRS